VSPQTPPPAIKRLGQNFLTDPNIVRKIVALADLRPTDHVLEIGPGRGVLTEALCRTAARVTAIEIDARLHEYLESRRQNFPHLELILGDALTYPLDTFPPGTIVVANLPYYLSTPLLFRLLEHRDRFPRMVLMLQNEVAERLAAEPGGPDYGVLSVMAQHAAEITKAFRVSAQCFRPRPDVGSAVVLLRTRGPSALTAQGEDAFSAAVHAAFAHRRKTVVNSLRDEGYDQREAAEALASLGLSTTIRAERLSLEQFVRLSRLLTRPAEDR
jgi:16S rRNA (adenine1518-N6/adenine1519-N6)-dimethyltransferase